MKAANHSNKIALLLLFAVLFSGCPFIDNTIESDFELCVLLNSLKYELYYFGNMPITDDIEIVGTVSILTNQLNVPQEWVDRFHGDVIDHVGFSNNYLSDNQSIKLSADYSDLMWHVDASPAILTLTDVKLRFRPLIRNVHPSGIQNYMPVISILPPSDTPCKDNQTRCDIDNVCYFNEQSFGIYHYSEYCNFCLGLDYDECACQHDNGTYLPDEIECGFIPPGDTSYSGTCQGACDSPYYN